MTMRRRVSPTTGPPSGSLDPSSQPCVPDEVPHFLEDGEATEASPGSPEGFETENTPLLLGGSAGLGGASAAATNVDPLDQVPLGEGKEKKKHEIKRTGTMLGAILSMINYAMGAGILMFPYTYRMSGLMSGVCVSVVIIGLNFVSLHAIAVCSTEHGGFRTYQGIIRHYLGPFWRFVGEFAVFVGTTGSNMVYLQAISQFVMSAVQGFFPGVSTLFALSPRFVIGVVGCVFVYPLMLLREVKKLSFTSGLATAGAIYVTGLLVVTGIIHIAEGKIGRDVFSGPGGKGTGLLLLQTKTFGPKALYYPWFFLAPCVKTNGYGCTSIVPPAAYEMKNCTTRRLVICIVCFLGTISAMYLLSGIFGFIAFGADVSDNILNSFTPSQGEGMSIAANIARVAIGINLIFTVPVVAYPAKLVVVSLSRAIFAKCRSWCGKKKPVGKLKAGDAPRTSDEELSTFGHLSLSTAYFLVVVVFAMFVPNISIGFGFAGALGTSIMAFLCPGLLALKLATSRVRCQKWYFCCGGVMLIIWSVALTITGVIASTLSLLKAYNVL